MSKIAVIGREEVVGGFKALGITVLPATDVIQAREKLEVASGGEYAVLYITEDLAHGLLDEIKELQKRPIPAVVLIPGSGGSTGLAASRMRELVKKAVGLDLLGRT